VSDVPIKGPDGVTRNVDTFSREVEGRVIHTQATANADPATGAHVPLATEATLQLLSAAADAIRAAAETLAGRQAGLTDTQLRAAPVPVDMTGELLEATEALRMCARQLSRTVGLLYPDTAGRMRVIFDANSAMASISTVNNQLAMGGISANDQVPALMRLRANTVRANINVS
jgi:hypothetical protein